MSTSTRRPALSPAEAGVAVGDFFVSSWGYDQTNIDFYKVVALTAKGMKVQQWSSKMAEGAEVGGPQEKVVPGDGPRMEADWSEVTPEMDYWQRQAVIKQKPSKVEQKRLQGWSSGNVERIYFTVNSYSSAYKWDGQPESKTGSGWGH